MIKFQLGKIGVKFLISSALLGAFDMIMENQGFNTKLLIDSSMFGMCEIIPDLFMDLWDINNGIYNISGMILKPLLSGILYAFLYDKFISNYLGYNSLKRNSYYNFILSVGGNILTKYIQNPIESLLFGY